MSGALTAFPLGATVLHQALAGINARLDLAFPASVFARPIVPPRLTGEVWRELTRRTPLVGVGWNAVEPQRPQSRSLNATSKWTVFLVARNAGGPAQRFLGDALGPGLFDMVCAAAAVLNGTTIAGVGTAFVSGITNTVGVDWDMENLVLACLDLDVGVSVPQAPELLGTATDGPLTLGITWVLPDGTTENISTGATP